MGLSELKLKSLVQSERWAAYESKEPRRGVWVPLWRPVAPQQGGGVGTELLQQGSFSPCRCVWAKVGPTKKIAKI